MHLKTCLSLAAVLALGACATPGPYAEIVVDRVSIADPNEGSVLIMGVDGRLYPSGKDVDRIEPGKRRALFRALRQDGQRSQWDQELVFDAKVCTRYYIVAKHRSAFRVDPWMPGIAKEEAMPECVAKYGSQPAAAAAK